MIPDESLSLQQRFPDKVVTAAQAVALIQPGHKVFVGTACAAPGTLVDALESLKNPPPDVELVHFLTTAVFPHDADGRALTRYRHRTFFVGSDIRAAVRQGLADYVPIPLSRIPSLMEIGSIPVDVALIQVSPPDAFGYVSLGVSVDVIPAAVARASLVIAEVNDTMPRTQGDASLHVRDIHKLVPVSAPIVEYSHEPAADGVVQRIARYIAGIIDDSSTLQIGLGRIPNEALKFLADRRDLGIHSDVITDAILPLMASGIVTGRHKSQHRNKVVTSFAIGTRALYDIVDDNPLFSFQPADMVCGHDVIAAQHKMVSVTQAFAVDLTGQACTDHSEGEFYGGVGAQLDFIRGAARSPGGKPILCLASTTDDGKASRIRAQLAPGEGATLARTDVHYVITEFGIAYLQGKSIRERALALITVAHPDFRAQLLDDAKRLGYLDPATTVQSIFPYPVEDERQVALRNGKPVLLRPATVSDAAAIKALFYHLPDGDRYTRFFGHIKALSANEVQRLCNLDYTNAVAFVAVQGPRENESVVGHATYFVNPTLNVGETAFMIDPAWQSTGLGTAMQMRLMEHAKGRGLRGFVADVLPSNTKMQKLARSCCDNVTVERDDDTTRITMLF